jgi:formylglycine-generating enzyme required for sulfatase activity
MSEPTQEELLAELAAMKRAMAEMQKQLEATQSGSGSIAQGGSTAAGAGGVAVGGNVEGGIYIGEPPTNSAEALRIYREVYISTCRQLPLRGVDVGASDPTSGNKPLDLDQVYISLDTTQSEEVKGERGKDTLVQERSQPISVLKASAHNRRLVVLGDPGSGKSTFLNHLGLCLALHGLKTQDGWLARLPDWPDKEADALPILVVLRDFAAATVNQARVEPQTLWSFIAARLAAQNLGFAEKVLHDALESGQAIVLLDGLDEIPTKEQRIFVRNAVDVFARRYPRSRLIITCRTLSYQDPAWQLPDISSVELAPFSAEKIDQFIAAWYAELSRSGVIGAQQATWLAARLQEAIRRADLWRLAPNPLLLTVMALVHTHKGRLPDARALLYEETVDILLWRWEQIKTTSSQETPRLRQLLSEADRADVDLKRVLWQLAYDSHAALNTDNSEALADIGELRLQRALAGLHPERSLNWAEAVVEAMKTRAGLLLERVPEYYTFPHRTFQEYLAGAHLASQGNFARKVVKLTESLDLWRQVILLAVGRLVYFSGEFEKPLILVGELCPHALPVDAPGWRRVWLAGEVLVEMGLNRVEETALGRDLLHRVRLHMAALLRIDILTPVERARVGDVLARLGDPRFRADTWYLPDEPLLGFVEIPASPFLMGSDKTRDARADDDELPQHEVNLPTYYMARYPVTVAQFRTYLEATERQPGDANALRDPANRPVRRVTWHEALAYCQWLTEMLRSAPQTPPTLKQLFDKGGQVMLPSEAEWEKAARGNDGRIFPWPGEGDTNRANYGATQIGDTSTVGCFPGGASPYKVEEFSGNVWEWTRSLWGDYPYPATEDDRQRRENLDAPDSERRVLRGGAFYSSGVSVRCAYRGGFHPRNWDLSFGFRVVVVVSPFTSGL